MYAVPDSGCNADKDKLSRQKKVKAEVSKAVAVF